MRRLFFVLQVLDMGRIYRDREHISRAHITNYEQHGRVDRSEGICVINIDVNILEMNRTAADLLFDICHAFIVWGELFSSSSHLCISYKKNYSEFTH